MGNIAHVCNTLLMHIFELIYEAQSKDVKLILDDIIKFSHNFKSLWMILLLIHQGILPYLTVAAVFGSLLFTFGECSLH